MLGHSVALLWFPSLLLPDRFNSSHSPDTASSGLAIAVKHLRKPAFSSILLSVPRQGTAASLPPSPQEGNHIGGSTMPDTTIVSASPMANCLQLGSVWPVAIFNLAAMGSAVL